MSDVFRILPSMVVLALTAAPACGTSTAPKPTGSANSEQAEPEPPPEQGEPEPQPEPQATAYGGWPPDFDCKAIAAERDKTAHNEDDATGETDGVPSVTNPRGIRALVKGAGLAVNGSLFVGGEQCGSDRWVTGPRFAGDPGQVVANGASVRVVGRGGVRREVVTVDVAHTEATIPPGAGQIELVLPRGKPSRRATVVDKRLSRSGPEAAVAEAWIEKQESVAYHPVGTLTGKFGGGVDTFVVLEPITIWPSADPEADPDYCATEFVVALSGGSVKGVLPLTRDAGRTGRGRCWCEEDDARIGVDGIEVAAVFDLDGDGNQEVAWVHQAMAGDLVTSLSVTYFADGAFEHHELGSCSYNGCEAFLGQDDCGRSPVKAGKGLTNGKGPHGNDRLER